MKTFLCFIALTALSLSAPLMAQDNADNGRQLYRHYCTQCHGLDGDGGGINVKDMAVVPRDHTDKAEMSARTDADLFKAIKHGGKSINKSMLMPQWGNNLTDQQINDLVAYLRQLCCSQ